MSTVRRTTTKGVSLSRGPALALGTFLVIAGLYFIYMEHGFPRLSQFPNGTAHTNGKAFFGVFGLNGWSGELTVAAGGLLMLGAAQHTLAKTASFVVAVVLAGVGVWALVNHHSALGLFAAGTWTAILWFAAAAYLLINMTLPRVGGDTVTTSEATATGTTTAVPTRTATTTEPATAVDGPATSADDSAVTADGDHAVRTRRGTLRRPRTRV